MVSDIILLPNTKAISLTKGKIAIVDDEDYCWLIKQNWYFDDRYAARTHCRKKVYMHRLILKTDKNMHTDHINGNKLDNRKCNLRICTNKENKRNVNKYKGGTSQYKGVHWDSERELWFAQIKIGKSSKYLGRFSSEEDAANTYNKYAKDMYGEFAKLNIIESLPRR